MVAECVNKRHRMFLKTSDVWVFGDKSLFHGAGEPQKVEIPGDEVYE